MKRARQPALNEGILKQMLSSEGAELQVLRLMIEYLQARGGLIALAGKSELFAPVGAPTILFMFGEFEKSAVVDPIREFYKTAWRRREEMATVIELESRFACCAVPYSRDQVLGVSLWGGARARFDDLSLLLVFSRLVQRSVSRHYAVKRCRETQTMAPKKFPETYVEGCSIAMKSVHNTIAALSDDTSPVLLLGETGVGKEHIAQLLHSWSSRSEGPFIAVNCAAIPAELLEAEMFGIDKGVASGVTERPGYFQLADGGTLFLDEVADLLLPLQAKLLRALQTREVRRVGGTLVKVDVRVVAATNADLKSRVDSLGFRGDLYYRLAGFELCVPPLRERKEDLLLLVEHFVRLFAQAAGKSIKGITFQALERLVEYSWPGNVRELLHELNRLVCICPNGESISPALLSPRFLYSANSSPGRDGHPTTFRLEAQLAEVERRAIIEALNATGSNHSQAARLLGVSRNGLSIKMARLGITD
ncbi:MAG TPA: sigma-54 dependent transcriptional regulator [Pyrinomonadaceae bacterium]|nr:sigma-54 dependent transcriptional regulator [Pyrinomonadaceae bacterium]